MLTVAIIGVVAAVVIVASVVAHRSDPDVASNRPSLNPSTLPSISATSTVFSSREGSGRLTLLAHHWATGGTPAPIHGTYLRVKVKITATKGRISYDSGYFQIFDDAGRVVRPTRTGAPDSPLGTGVLRPGKSVQGNILFDIRRGDVTLLMSNALKESVTALRVAG